MFYSASTCSTCSLKYSITFDSVTIPIRRSTLKLLEEKHLHKQTTTFPKFIDCFKHSSSVTLYFNVSKLSSLPHTWALVTGGFLRVIVTTVRQKKNLTTPIHFGRLLKFAVIFYGTLSALQWHPHKIPTVCLPSSQKMWNGRRFQRLKVYLKVLALFRDAANLPERQGSVSEGWQYHIKGKLVQCLFFRIFARVVSVFDRKPSVCETNWFHWRPFRRHVFRYYIFTKGTKTLIIPRTTQSLIWCPRERFYSYQVVEATVHIHCFIDHMWDLPLIFLWFSNFSLVYRVMQLYLSSAIPW